MGCPREHESHKNNAKSTLECITPTDRKKKELELGSRFTELFKPSARRPVAGARLVS